MKACNEAIDRKSRYVDFAQQCIIGGVHPRKGMDQVQFRSTSKRILQALQAGRWPRFDPGDFASKIFCFRLRRRASSFITSA